jgi:hypothetical protein
MVCTAAGLLKLLPKIVLAQFKANGRACDSQDAAEVRLDQYTDGARHLLAIEISGMWQNGGYAGSDVVAANDRSMSDSDASDIGNPIEWTQRQDPDLQS